MRDGRLLIIGAGRFGQMVREIALETESFSQIDFLDDSSPLAIGKIEELSAYLEDYGCAICAIGNSAARERITEHIVSCGYRLPRIVSPYAYVSPSSVLGDGVIVEPMAVVQMGVSVGRGSIVSSGAVLRHDSRVGNMCHVDCGSVVRSGSAVPDGTKVECLTVFENN